MDNFIFFLKEGLFHVLDWNAYDHILFLIALVVVYEFKNWKKVLWLITLFTIGHTFSLILATYKIVSVSSNWVEFLIPATILITAAVNVFYAKRVSRKTKIKTNTNLFFALFFGLIHGLGFSSYFNLLTGTSNSKLMPILEFALGIEFAQVIIVFIILFLGFIFQMFFRVSKRDYIIIISSIVIGAVLPLLKKSFFW